MERLVFNEVDKNNVLASMQTQDIDSLTFGAVEVNEEGVILSYNKAEGKLANIDPAEAIGKNFFTELAPCTNTPFFFGKFKKGVSSGNLNISFEYVFTYRMKPTRVQVYMKKALIGNSYWIFIKDRSMMN